MKDPQLMYRILDQAAKSCDGRFAEIVTFGSDDTRFHHVELLCDAGLMAVVSMSDPYSRVARVTDNGYKFLETTSQGPGARERFRQFVDGVNSGVRLAEVVAKILNAGASPSVFLAS